MLGDVRVRRLPDADMTAFPDKAWEGEDGEEKRKREEGEQESSRQEKNQVSNERGIREQQVREPRNHPICLQVPQIGGKLDAESETAMTR